MAPCPGGDACAGAARRPPIATRRRRSQVLNPHLLRDIGAPHELIARHVEEIEPRALLGALEVRG